MSCRTRRTRQTRQKFMAWYVCFRAQRHTVHAVALLFMRQVFRRRLEGGVVLRSLLPFFILDLRNSSLTKKQLKQVPSTDSAYRCG